MSISELIPTLNIHFNIPLIYPKTTEAFTNVLLIDDSVQDSQIIFDSVNSNTFPIIYSRNSEKTKLMELLDSKCKSIHRIGILFNSLGKTPPLFLDLKPLMLSDEAAAPYSENVKFMIELLKKFQVKNIDYLACNTLLYDSWKTYYAILKDQTGVIVGASNDRTGNIKYGGNWIMESTNQDIELVYFTRNIEYYQYLFDIYTDSQGLNYYYIGTRSIATVTSGNYSNVKYDISSSISIDDTNYSVTSIDDYAFQYRGLTSITIPSSVTSIGHYAFQFCSGLTSITIPNSVTSIGMSAFEGCSGLTSITIPNSITGITYSVFQGCTGLTSITIPNNFINIGSSAFGYCSGLTSITIPSSVTSIGNYAFYGCSMLSTVIFYGLTIPSIGNLSFYNIAIPSSAYYVNGATNISNLDIFTNIIPIPPPTITTISPSTGFTRGNTSVIITGTDLIYNPVVLFDSSTAIITSFSNTQIICSTPSHSAGTVTVTVTTPAGSATTNFTYIIPIPTIISISPSTGFARGNTSVIITGTDLIYNPIVLFDSFLATITSFSNTQIICKTPSHSAGTVTVTLTTPGGSTTTNFTYIDTPCFKEDSKILTDKGYIPVQDLRKGDLVNTLLHGFIPIVMIGKREIEHIASQERIKDQLYKCSPTEYPELIEDLIITGCHSILVDNFVSKEQRENTKEVNGNIYITDNKYRLPACADERASVYEIPGKYMIYHIALENPDYYMNYGIYANGLLVETCSKRYLKELSGMEEII